MKDETNVIENDGQLNELENEVVEPHAEVIETKVIETKVIETKVIETPRDELINLDNLNIMSDFKAFPD